MTAAAARVYPCAHCGEQFSNPVRLGGHVHAAHPGHRRAAPKWLSKPRPAAIRPNLKRDTDIWPARP